MNSITARAMAKRKEVAADLDSCRRQMNIIQARMRDLQGQMKLLVELLGEDTEDEEVIVSPTPDQPHQGGLRPVDAILQYLSEHPAGSHSKDIADTLEDKIATTSGNPRNIIHNTLHSLCKRSKARKDDTTGLFYPAGDGIWGSLEDLDI